MHAGKIRNVSAATTFLCVYSIAVAAFKKGYAFCFWSRCCCCQSFFLLAALLLLLVLVLLTTSVLKQREVPATVCSFYVSVLCTAMLRTSIAAVVLGCFHFCPLDCDIPGMVVDCTAVETGCMLEKFKMVALLQCYNNGGYIRTWYV